MKRLLISAALLCSTPAWGATALEIKHCDTQTQTIVTTDTWTSQTGSACTFDRSGEAGTKEFFIFAQMTACSEASTIRAVGRLLHDHNGTHTAGTSTTVLTDSAAAFPTATGGIVGYTLFNTTDDSLCIVTANTDTTATCSHGLEGGTDNDWDTSDAYVLAVGATGIKSSDVTSGASDEGTCHAAAPGSNGSGFPPWTIVRRITLDNSSHTFTWQATNATASGNFRMEQSSIVILERSANAEYADIYSDENYDPGAGVLRRASSTEQDLLALSFTATAEVWVIVFNVELNTEDEGDADSEPGSFQRETSHSTPDTIYSFGGRASYIASTGNHMFNSASSLGIETLTAATHRFVIHNGGGGLTGDEMEVARASIIAFPVSDFENSYFDCDGSSGDCASNTGSLHADSYSDTLADLDSQAITASKTHLVLAGYAVSNEDATARGSIKLHVDGDESIYRNPDDRGAAVSWNGLAIDAKDTTGSTATFKVMAISSDAGATKEAIVHAVYMVVLEIPAAAGGGGPRRRVNVIIGGP